MLREAAVFTVLEFNDTACKSKQGWREAYGEGSKEEGKGGREEEELSGCGPGFNYKNNIAYIDSESLHMVLCFFTQIDKRKGIGRVFCNLRALCVEANRVSMASPTNLALSPLVGCVCPPWAADCLSKPHRVFQVFSYILGNPSLTRRPVHFMWHEYLWCRSKPSHVTVCNVTGNLGLGVFYVYIHTSIKPVSFPFKYAYFPSFSWYSVLPPLIRC